MAGWRRLAGQEPVAAIAPGEVESTAITPLDVTRAVPVADSAALHSRIVRPPVGIAASQRDDTNRRQRERRCPYQPRALAKVVAQMAASLHRAPN